MEAPVEAAAVCRVANVMRPPLKALARSGRMAPGGTPPRAMGAHRAQRSPYGPPAVREESRANDVRGATDADAPLRRLRRP